jgi:hypothetical protein
MGFAMLSIVWQLLDHSCEQIDSYDLSVWKNNSPAPRYFFVLFIPFFYIQDYGAFHNVNQAVLSYLVALMNVMGVIARIGLGLVADKLGMCVNDDVRCDNPC